MALLPQRQTGLLPRPRTQLLPLDMGASVRAEAEGHQQRFGAPQGAYIPFPTMPTWQQVMQYAKEHPLDALAGVTAPIPVVGDATGLLADSVEMAQNPSATNAMLLGIGAATVAPSGAAGRMADALFSPAIKTAGGTKLEKVSDVLKYNSFNASPAKVDLGEGIKRRQVSSSPWRNSQIGYGALSDGTPVKRGEDGVFRPATIAELEKMESGLRQEFSDTIFNAKMRQSKLDLPIQKLKQYADDMGLEARMVVPDDSNSRYLYVKGPDGKEIKIRAADHPQPYGYDYNTGKFGVMGGYSKTEGKRHSPADISIDPVTGDIVATGQRAIRDLAQQGIPTDTASRMPEGGMLSAPAGTVKRVGGTLTAFHGSDVSGIKNFDLTKSKRGASLGRAIHLTPSEDVAKQYGKNIYKAEYGGNGIDLLDMTADQRNGVISALEDIVPQERLAGFGSVKKEYLDMTDPVAAERRFNEIREKTSGAWHDRAKASLEQDENGVFVQWMEPGLSGASDANLASLVNEFAPELPRTLGYDWAKHGTEIAVYDPKNTKIISESLPTDTPSRMGRPEQADLPLGDTPDPEGARIRRAQKMGYNTDLELWRGTTVKGEKEVPQSFEAGAGIFTSTNPDVAEVFRYPREYGESVTEVFDDATGDFVPVDPGDIQKVYARMQNPLVLSGDQAQEFTSDTAMQSRMIKDAIKRGKDSIILEDVIEGVGENVHRGTTIVALKPIRSTKAKFDPSRADSANLMAGIAGGLLGLGAYNRLSSEEEY